MHKNAKGSSKIWTFQFCQIFIVATLITFATQFQATTFPLYVQHLGGNLAIAGLMTSIYMGTSAVSKPFVGAILNKHPRKRLFIIFGVIFTIILSSFGYMSIIPLIMVIRAINAPCYSICSTASTTIATDFIPEDRLVEGIGYFNFSQTLSSALGATIALSIINNLGYKALFFSCSGCVIVAVIIGLTIKYDDPILKKDSAAKEPAKKELAEKVPFKVKLKTLFSTSMFAPCMMSFFILVGSSGVVTYLPTWGKAVGIANIGAFFTAQAVTLAIARLFVGRINKAIGTKRSLILGIVCIEICMIGIRFCTSLLPICILALFLGFGSGTIVPTMHAIIVMMAPLKERGMANSVFQMANDAGICVCSLTLGIIAQSLGILNVFTYAAVFPIIALVIYFTKVRSQINELNI